MTIEFENITAGSIRKIEPYDEDDCGTPVMPGQRARVTITSGELTVALIVDRDWMQSVLDWMDKQQ